MLMRFVRVGLPVVAVAALAVVGPAAGSAHSVGRAARLAPARGGQLARPSVARRGVLRAPRSAFLHVRRGTVLAAGSSITSCNVEIKHPGTYTLANNVDGSGDLYCIWIASSGVNLNLNGHKITDTAGTATYGVLVEATNNTTSLRDDSVYGGKISNYYYGVYLDVTTRTSLSKLKILMGSASAYGVFAYYSADSLTSATTVNVGTTDGKGWFGTDGSGNKVTGSRFTYTASGPVLLDTNYEYEDTFSNDTAECTSGGKPTYNCTGTGYTDYESNRDTFSGDKSYGNHYGFFLEEDGYGIVTATNDMATDYNAGTAYGADGFFNYENYDRYNYLYKHSTYSGNTVQGFEDGFNDYYSPRAVYSSNTVNYASSYGYYFDYPVGYSITGNTSTGTNTASDHTISSADGFYLTDDYSNYSPIAFNGNHSNYNHYGFYSTDQAIHGSGNTAKGDQYNAYRVEVG